MEIAKVLFACFGFGVFATAIIFVVYNMLFRSEKATTFTVPDKEREFQDKLMAKWRADLVLRGRQVKALNDISSALKKIIKEDYI